MPGGRNADSTLLYNLCHCAEPPMPASDDAAAYGMASLRPGPCGMSSTQGPLLVGAGAAVGGSRARSGTPAPQNAGGMAHARSVP